MEYKMNFLICDLECTSASPTNAEILTGSFLYCDKDLNILDKYYLESRPRLWDKDAEDAVAIHGITHAQAMRFTPFHQAMGDLVDWLSFKKESHFVAHANRTIFGSFSTYDYAVLTTKLFDIQMQNVLYTQCPRKKIISTHSLAKYLGVGSELNLKVLAQHFGLSEFAHHDAQADAMIALELLRKMLPQVDLQAFFNYENFKLKDEDESEGKGISKRTKSRPSKRKVNSTQLI